MADENYLYAGRQRPFQSLLQGFGAGQGIMGNISRNNVLAEKAQHEKIVTAMKLHDELKGMAYGNLDYYNNQYRPTLMKIGVPEEMLPTYDKVEDLNAGLYRNEQIKAMWKQKLEGPKVVPERGAIYEGGNFLYPEVSPARRAMLESDRQKEAAKLEVLAQKFGYDKALEMMKQENALTRINANAEKAPKTFRPDLVDTEEGLGYANPTTGVVTPLKGTKGKAKAGGDVEIRKAAAQLAIDAQLVPGTKEFDAAFEANVNLLSGKMKPSASKSNKTITRTGTYNGRRVKQYSDGSIEYAD